MIYRVRTVFTGVPGTPWYSNLYFDGDDTGTIAGVHALVVDFWDAIAGLQSGDVVWTVESTVVTLNEEGGQVEAYTEIGAATGDGAGDPATALPWQTQALIRLNTDGVRAGRRVLGRIFVPGLLESQNESGVLSGALVSALQGAIDGLVTGAAANETSMVVWGRPATGLGLGDKYLVTAATINPGWSYLSSRRD